MKPDPEASIRLYLMFLADPTSMVDRAAVAKLQTQAEKAKDPIDKLKALSELERAQAPDGDTLLQGFVTHAKAFAEANSITIRSLQQLGVSDTDLAAAGFDLGTPRTKKAAKAKKDTKPRAQSVGTQAVKAHLLSITGKFTLQDIMKTVGGSPITVKKAIDELITEGTVKRLGAVPGYSGRGRAPVQFSR